MGKNEGGRGFKKAEGKTEQSVQMKTSKFCSFSEFHHFLYVYLIYILLDLYLSVLFSRVLV